MRFLGGYIISGIVVVAITESSNSNSLNKIVYFGGLYDGKNQPSFHLVTLQSLGIDHILMVQCNSETFQPVWSKKVNRHDFILLTFHVTELNSMAMPG